MSQRQDITIAKFEEKLHAVMKEMQKEITDSILQRVFMQPDKNRNTSTKDLRVTDLQSEETL